MFLTVNDDIYAHLKTVREISGIGQRFGEKCEISIGIGNFWSIFIGKHRSKKKTPRLIPRGKRLNFFL